MNDKCYFEFKGKCRILIKKDCKNCNFFKTEEQYLNNLKKAKDYNNQYLLNNKE